MHQATTTTVRTEWSKRALDVTVAVMAIVIVSPLLLVLVVLIRATSPGPALFRQTRIGAAGRGFVMLKFRTMQDGCSDDAHRAYIQDLFTGEAKQHDGLYKLDTDPRITRVGRILRRFSLDELPQLINVLRGEMSLVGPRPALPWELRMFPSWAHRRLEAPPGLTGLWQVSGRNRLTMLEGLRLDVRYVEERSFWVDLRILVMTPVALLVGAAR
ncbi:MAG: sugar transferase [Propionibacteriales bacterium]|nr:sugar transferase [Propionibacteriales bacterium]